MINFYDGQIKDILPANLMREPAAQAFSYALREGMRLLDRYTQLLYIYCSIETAPEYVVDLLAKELRTQYYNDALGLDIKRGLVRNTLTWYMAAGTPAAVEELVAAVFGTGEVSEWFEFGGEPYWFRVKTDTIITEEMTIFFTDMIRRVKNTRSHLDAIEIPREINQAIFLYPGCYLSYEPEPIIDGYYFSSAVNGEVKAGATVQQEHEAILMDGYEAARHAGGTIYAGTIFSNIFDQAITTE